MTVFEIRDSSQRIGREDRVVGYLFYYERDRRFYAELPEGLDEWEVPAMFYGHAKRGERFVDAEWTMKWVRQRIIPADRQNIGSILKIHGLKTYDEYRLLCLSEGHCAQDECYIVRTEEAALPEEIRQRLLRKVRDVLPLSDFRLCVFFRDGAARMVDAGQLLGGRDAFRRILREEEIFERVKVAPGGNGIEWGDERGVSAELLYGSGEKPDVSYNDFLRFARVRLVDTPGAGEMLGVSRQYLNQLVGEDRLHPVISDVKGRVFLRAEVEDL